MESISSISLSRATRDMLKELGRKGETYDDLIRELVKLKRKTENKGKSGFSTGTQQTIVS
jgi:hypothetical protein